MNDEKTESKLLSEIEKLKISVQEESEVLMTIFTILIW